jgi:hypothetical protein
VQNGEDSRSFHRLVMTIANLALAPFAIALGLDVVVTFGHLFGEVSGVFAGITAAAVAIGFWTEFRYPNDGTIANRKVPWQLALPRNLLLRLSM